MKIEEDNYWWLMPVFIFLIWLAGWWVVDYVLYPAESCNYISNRGSFGDKFGAINPALCIRIINRRDKIQCKIPQTPRFSDRLTEFLTPNTFNRNNC